ncbi:CBS domain-containing protein [Mesorhizobium sp. A556]
MRVSECMTKDVRFAKPDVTLRDAAKAMAILDVGLLPVADNSRLIGMVSDRDITVRGMAAGLGPDTPVREVMSTEVKYCFDDEEIANVLENMGNIQVRRLPVLNREKRLVGIVSLGDLATNSEPTHAGEALGGISKPGGEHSQTTH